MILAAGETTAVCTPLDPLHYYSSAARSISAPHTVSLNLSPSWGASARCLGASSVRLFSPTVGNSREEHEENLQDHTLWTEESDAEQSDEQCDESLTTLQGHFVPGKERKMERKEVQENEGDDEHEKLSLLSESNDGMIIVRDVLEQVQGGHNNCFLQEKGQHHQHTTSGIPHKMKKFKSSGAGKGGGIRRSGNGFRVCPDCHVMHHYKSSCGAALTPQTRKNATAAEAQLNSLPRPSRCFLY